MLDKFDSLKGYFLVQSIKDGKVVDEYEDHNFIMAPARISMAELFIRAKNRRINKLRLGTCGTLGNDTYSSINETNGFSKERTCLYSDSVKTVNIGSSVTIRTGEIIEVQGSNYQYTKNSKGNAETIKSLTASVLSEKFTLLEDPIYNYDINVKEYSDVSFSGEKNYAAGTDSNVYIEYKADSTEIKYTFQLATSAGNGQTSRNQTFFSEAGIYINGRLFCMKCFPSKLKDEATTLKIIWKIIF